jgi:prepilin-type N-terminal cleavage/methylation domain-containing protein
LKVEMRTRSTKKEIRDQRPEVEGQRSSDFRPRTSGLGPQTRRRQAAAGFTLLELMTVMVIMFIMMGVSTLALRGIMRGAGISGAVSNVRSMLTQARQQAIMNQQPTAVVFHQAASTNTMQILTSYGRVETGGGGGFTPENELPWDASELEGVVVFNFEDNTGTFTGKGDSDTGEMFTDDIMWSSGDDIAFQVGAVRPIPDGIEFGSLPDPPVVVFDPDGSARSGLSIKLLEKNVEQNAENRAGFTITVNQQTGWIDVVEPGGT